ncbi:MAG: alpha/beta hydrolase [Planctomycetaceae bacterium]|nr:alpha/beta hydrolase [Planctomycetaceae bacterium]
MRRTLFTSVVFSVFASMCGSALSADGFQLPEFRPLWPDGAPQATGDTDADKPGLWIYPAGKKSTGAAIVICPGGGYAIHAVDHEGVQPAKYFNSIGVTAFVLRYRLSPYQHPIPLLDAQRALRFVRSHAEEFGIDKHRVGIMGFSAGGHLTSTSLTHFDGGDVNAADAIDKESCRPDFGILGYPVVSLSADYAHRGSGRNLLGEDATADELKSLSNEFNVTAETPPVFLFHTNDDTGVSPENSVSLYLACRKASVPVEMHIYQQGPHGVGLANEHPALSQWIATAGTWLRQNGLLVSGKRQAIQGEVKLNGELMKWGTIAFEPADTNAPVAWAMISKGKYEIPAGNGTVPGECKVVVTSLGAIAPGPTADNAVEVANDLSYTVNDGPNSLDLELTDKN